MSDLESKRKVESDSIRLALDEAWRDHHHVREQTWKAVQIEAVLAAGLVTVDLQYQSFMPTFLASALVVWAAVFGMWISLHHRRVEVKKFEHITNLERALGLIADDLIPESSIKPASELRWFHIFSFKEKSTAAFILRMHATILMFAILVLIARFIGVWRVL